MTDGKSRGLCFGVPLNGLGRRQVLQALAMMLWIALSTAMPPPARAEDPTTASLIAEVRQSFTLKGERIPPEIFRDFGDGNLADSQLIWVTVDVRAAIGSNLYADDIKQNGDWVIQRKAAPGRR
jgi:hypothetical protein